MSTRPQVVIATLIAAAGLAAAQSDQPKPRNYLERTVTLTGQMRERWEATDGSDFSVTPADSYIVSRIRLGVAFKPVTWLRFFAETQDSRVLFYRTKPSSSVANPFDFRQGYVEAGALEGRGVKVRLGRQDLFIGSGRLFTTGDWSNTTRTYDAARATFTAAPFALDLIAGSPMLADSTRMDRHKPGEHFYVAYSTFKKLIPDASFEPYLMARTQLKLKGKDGVLGNADTLYLGARLVGKTKGRLDYSLEGVREAGGYAHDSIRAWGAIAGGGWLVSPALWNLHLTTEYTGATGDSGKKDGVHQQFDFLYGAQQPATSLTGLFSWRNIRDWRAGADFKPLKKLTVKVDFRDYWLATTADGLYNSGGTRTVFNSAATSAHVGEGVDTQFLFALNKKTTIGTGVANLSPGSYLVQSHKTSGFVYPFLYVIRQL